MLKLKLKKKKKYGKPPVTNFYKTRREHDAFLTMLNMFTIQNPDRLQAFINNQWKIYFPSRVIPQEGRSLQKLKVALQYQIVLKAYMNNSLEPTDRFMKNYKHAINYLETDSICKSLDKIEQSNELSKIIIYPIQGETIMAVKKKILKKKTAVKKVLKKKVAAPKKKKALAPKKKTGEDTAAPVADKKVKPSTFYFCTELMKRKFTDADILKKVREKTGKSLDSGYVPYCRKRLNAGTQKGFDKASPAIKEIAAK